MQFQLVGNLWPDTIRLSEKCTVMLVVVLVMLLVSLETNMQYYIIPNTGPPVDTGAMVNISVPIGATVRFHCTVSNVEQKGVGTKSLNKK